tara:strand:- start:301 stop:495 length:195 start_codon:yes stop_codon:yes gene_type:complete
MNWKSFISVGVSIGKAKYRQHLAVQYSQRISSGFNADRGVCFGFATLAIPSSLIIDALHEMETG